jgi:Mrp family chromosome partitioning ATPase
MDDEHMDRAEGMTLRDYARVLARRWWLILLVAVVAAGSAFLFSWRQTPVYEATAKILYQPRLNVADPLSSVTVTTADARQAELEAVVTVIAGPEMQQIGSERLGETLASPADYEITAEVEPGSTTATASSVATINARSEDPRTARAAANGYAAAFIDFRKDEQQTQVDKALKALRKRMSGFPEAAKTSPDYLTLAQRVQDLLILKSTVTGDFKLVVPAALPSDPVEPRPLRSSVLGLAVGLFAGIGLAFLLEQFDTRLRSRHELSTILGMPVLGRVPRFSNSENPGPLVVVEDPGSHAAEAFRMIRGNLDFVAFDADECSVVVTSCEPGEGKTVTACNLAAAMALAGKRVVLVDADLRRPRVHAVTHVDGDKGLSSVLAGRQSLADALQDVTVTPPPPEAPQNGGQSLSLSDSVDAVQPDSHGPLHFSVLAGGPRPPNPGEMLSSQRFRDLIGQIREIADVVLVDTTPLLAVGDAAAVARAVGGLVFVVDMAIARRPTIKAAAEHLQHLPCKLLGVVVNREARGKGRGYYDYGYSHYHDEGRPGDT